MSAMDANFQNAQLAQAAYAVGLVPGMASQNNSAYLNQLKSDEVGMSDAQAKKFADNYRVEDQYTDSATGFSATVFSDAGGQIYLAIRGTEGLFSDAQDRLIKPAPPDNTSSPSPHGELGDDTFLVEGTDSAYDEFNGGDGTDTILGGDGDDTIRLRSFDASRSVEVIDGGTGTNVIAGNSGYDTIDLSATTVLNIDHIDGGAGNDTITATDGADLIIGGTGRDILNGGQGSDQYRFNRDDGRDLILDADTTTNSDLIQFAVDIRHDQLWFSKVNNDLLIDIIGTSDSITIDGWYTDPANQIEMLQAGDGYMLLDTRVDQLVQAMASFSPPNSGELDLPSALQSQLDPVLAVNWQIS